MNLFAFGKNNSVVVECLLDYGNEKQWTGLCGYLAEAEDFEVGMYYWGIFQDESPFKFYEEQYPVECAINPDGRFEHWSRMYSNQYDMADVNTETGMLRRWWAYNLAVAVSNMEEIV